MDLNFRRGISQKKKRKEKVKKSKLCHATNSPVHKQKRNDKFNTRRPIILSNFIKTWILSEYILILKKLTLISPSSASNSVFLSSFPVSISSWDWCFWTAHSMILSGPATIFSNRSKLSLLKSRTALQQ